MALGVVDLVEPVRARRVGGGWSWRTYVVADATDHRVVVRVAPPGGTMAPYDPRAEATAMASAAGSVPVPDVLAVVDDPATLGAPFGVHAFAPGVVGRLSTVPAARRPAHRAAFATTLGRLHADGDAAVLDADAAAGTTTDALRRDLAATAAAFARGTATRHPGFTIGMRWLATHLPDVPDRPRVCHGDFRMPNLTWADDRVAAVLDWERAWVGDPMVDIAFTRRFSGWCAVDGDVVDTWERAAGMAVDEARVAYGGTYEWVRSMTSAVRGWHALANGRDDALDLWAIGEAGRAGTWAMVDLLADGPLLPAPDDGLSPRPRPVCPPERVATLARLARAAGDDHLADHLDDDARADEVALVDAVAALRRVVADGCEPPALAAAVAARDPLVAWRRAHEVLAHAALTGGPELVAPLHALGRRHTARPTLRRLATAGRST